MIFFFSVFIIFLLECLELALRISLSGQHVLRTERINEKSILLNST